MALVFVDCEAIGGCPRTGYLTEFGAVDYDTRKTFHGIITKSRPSLANPAVPEIIGEIGDPKPAFVLFEAWLKTLKGRPIFVSDNPAYDFQRFDGHGRQLRSRLVMIFQCDACQQGPVGVVHCLECLADFCQRCDPNFWSHWEFKAGDQMICSNCIAKLKG